jgi:hypothetical protein
MGEQERAVIVDLFRSEEYPSIDMVPPDNRHVSVINPEYYDISGWMYTFEIRADAEAFNIFRRTGSFVINLRQTPKRYEFKVGLENIGKFQDACRGSRSR